MSLQRLVLKLFGALFHSALVPSEMLTHQYQLLTSEQGPGCLNSGALGRHGLSILKFDCRLTGEQGLGRSSSGALGRHGLSLLKFYVRLTSQQGLGRSSSCALGRYALVHNDPVCQVGGHDEVVLHHEGRLLHVHDEALDDLHQKVAIPVLEAEQLMTRLPCMACTHTRACIVHKVGHTVLC